MKKANRKTYKTTIIAMCFFIAGIGLSSYSLISSLMESQKQKESLLTYQTTVKESEPSKLQSVIESAEKYNDILYQSKGFKIVNDTLSDESYENQLNVSQNGLMGSIEIPKIKVNLPIYHGTNEDVLSAGTGHIQGTSLPVGGENTHSVITGHRGLPNSKLFTRLDELEIGDMFYIQVCDKTLAYQVCKLNVVEPEDVHCLNIQNEKDMVSLVTCTPYGINSHRLIVTGERVAFEEAVKISIEPATASIREIALAVLPILFITIAIIVLFFSLRRKKKENTSK